MTLENGKQDGPIVEGAKEANARRLAELQEERLVELRADLLAVADDQEFTQMFLDKILRGRGAQTAVRAALGIQGAAPSVGRDATLQEKKLLSSVHLPSEGVYGDGNGRTR